MGVRLSSHDVSIKCVSIRIDDYLLNFLALTSWPKIMGTTQGSGFAPIPWFSPLVIYKCDPYSAWAISGFAVREIKLKIRTGLFFVSDGSWKFCL